MNKKVPTNIDEYISDCPAEVQPMLNELRLAIRKSAPMATEKISWGMATFVYHGNLVHFASQKSHIGFHPAPSSIEAFSDELKDFVCSKGTIRLPLNKPLPIPLIEKIVKFRVLEQEKLAKEKTDKV